MADKIDTTLKELTAVSKSLNQASDELSRQISELESALRELNLGVSAFVPFSKEPIEYKMDDGKVYVDHCNQDVGYHRLNGKWGLIVSTWYDSNDDPDTVKQTFLREAPREIRLVAMDKIPDLLKALSEEAQKVTQEATKKVAQIKDISTALRRKGR